MKIKMFIFAILCLLLVGCQKGITQEVYNSIKKENEEYKERLFILQSEYDRVSAELSEYIYNNELYKENAMEVVPSDDYKPEIINEDLSGKDYVNNVFYSESKTINNLIFIVTNNSTYSFPCLKANIVYYDDKGNMLSMDDAFIESFVPEQEGVLIFDLPKDKNQDYVEYEHYELTFISDDDWLFNHENLYREISIESNIGSEGVMVKLTNNSVLNIQEIKSYVIYYKDDEIVGYDSNSYNNNLGSGESIVIEYERPTIKDYISESFYSYKYAEYDTYKIYIQDALSDYYD